MKNQELEAIFELAKNDLMERSRINDTFYQWSTTFLAALKGEIQEVEAELKENNSVYLEDEVADLLWSLVCLISSLEQEKKADGGNIIKRCLKKYNDRALINRKVVNGEKESWQSIKQRQKEELQREHNTKYDNSRKR